MLTTVRKLVFFIRTKFVLRSWHMEFAFHQSPHVEMCRFSPGVVFHQVTVSGCHLLLVF